MSTVTHPNAVLPDVELTEHAAHPFILSQLFQADPNRGQRYAGAVGDIYVNYAKHWLTDETLSLLERFAEHRLLKAATEQLFLGATVNVSEQSPALHTALRDPQNPLPLMHNGQDARVLIRAVLEEMYRWVNRLHQRAWLGSTGETIEHIIHLGIGGSDVGPRLALDALAVYRHSRAPSVHFVTNIDGLEWQLAQSACDPAKTLIVIASKSFHSTETLLNAKTGREWLLTHGLNPKDHLVAITAYPERAKAWGIEPHHILTIGTWVGGRYSLWSAMGFCVAAVIGVEGFQSLLAGALAVDNHFRDATTLKNIPALLGLLSVWYRQYHRIHSRVLVPYTQALAWLPTYVQQLEMESCGKSCSQAGRPIATTGMAVWGQVGTNAQHTFYQWLHQSPDVALTDIIVVAKPTSSLAHQSELLASAVAQSQALLEGLETPNPHRMIPGNRPHTMIVLPELSPYTLGNLLASYEHQIYTQAVCWGINPFDQFGVELGKRLMAQLLPYLNNPKAASDDVDSATQAIIQKIYSYQSY